MKLHCKLFTGILIVILIIIQAMANNNITVTLGGQKFTYPVSGTPQVQFLGENLFKYHLLDQD